ncbi:hypothetical protein BGZ61DRAFT_460652 [Ilyonectria robusta]|uniref:uncharacterized protein n=1 Tax=Ilyonectria robusta TaxID=1079257 RepID=UPI001E8D3D25|nr:uncharacterized protein BGZ61DRAFT_460652 [Ilyonectria robusta]KAH8669259.1 hypothetical protein BGZ61DRAFT_460652 [Ilyonectria robusta]
MHSLVILPLAWISLAAANSLKSSGYSVPTANETPRGRSECTPIINRREVTATMKTVSTISIASSTDTGLEIMGIEEMKDALSAAFEALRHPVTSVPGDERRELPSSLRTYRRSLQSLE